MPAGLSCSYWYRVLRCQIWERPSASQPASQPPLDHAVVDSPPPHGTGTDQAFGLSEMGPALETASWVVTDLLYTAYRSTMTGSPQPRERGRAIAWYLCIYVVPLLQQILKGCQDWDKYSRVGALVRVCGAGCAPRRPTRWRTRLAVSYHYQFQGIFFNFSAARVRAGWSMVVLPC